MKFAKRALEVVNSEEYKTHRRNAVVNNFKGGHISKSTAVQQLNEQGFCSWDAEVLLAHTVEVKY